MRDRHLTFVSQTQAMPFSKRAQGRDNSHEGEEVDDMPKYHIHTVTHALTHGIPIILAPPPSPAHALNTSNNSAGKGDPSGLVRVPHHPVRNIYVSYRPFPLLPFSFFSPPLQFGSRPTESFYFLFPPFLSSPPSLFSHILLGFPLTLRSIYSTTSYG